MPQNITSKLFVPRTAEMLSPFLDLDGSRKIDSKLLYSFYFFLPNYQNYCIYQIDLNRIQILNDFARRERRERTRWSDPLSAHGGWLMHPVGNSRRIDLMRPLGSQWHGARNARLFPAHWIRIPVDFPRRNWYWHGSLHSFHFLPFSSLFSLSFPTNHPS